MRTPQPFYRKFTKSWYVELDGKAHPLGGKGKATKTPPPEVLEKYYLLMSGRQPDAGQDDCTVHSLGDRFLADIKKTKAHRTWETALSHIESFKAHVGPKLMASKVKGIHVREWMTDKVPGGGNYKNQAVRVVSQMFNWGMEMDVVTLRKNPAKKVNRPQPTSRVVLIAPAEWDAVMGRLKEKDPFRDVLVFLKETGCRPQEVRHIEKRHFSQTEGDEKIVFPIGESKGKKRSRMILLNPVALAIIRRLALKNPEGMLFRNRDGNAWTSDALNCRCAKLREKLGFDTIFPYAVRHTFITDMLVAGVDAITLAELVGHKDAQMILRVYQHVALVPGHLRKQLLKGTDDARQKGAQSA